MQINLFISNTLSEILSANFVFLCFDYGSRASFDAIQTNAMAIAKKKKDLILVGCKAEISSREVNFEDINDFLNRLQKYWKFCSFHSISASTGHGVVSLIRSIELRAGE